MSERLQQILQVHLHPVQGSSYWLERERALGFSIRDAVRTLDDLVKLGPFDLRALRARPIRDFIPKGLLGSRGLVTSETGGATGQPTPTAFFEDELERAFVQPFQDCVGSTVDFSSGHWLWLGPSGPHVIGKVARRIALATTGCDGFSIDFDPRWYRSLAQGSVARQRYLAHVLEQALPILLHQDIRFLFTTPPVLAALVAKLPQAKRDVIAMAYLGGMSVDPELLAALGDALPNALFLSGYGNSLFGVCHEAAPHRPDVRSPVYYAPGARLHTRIVTLEPSLADTERLGREVAEGERGQVVLSRLDESYFLPNVMERDSAVRVRGNAAGQPGLQGPEPVRAPTFTVDSGLY